MTQYILHIDDLTHIELLPTHRHPNIVYTYGNTYGINVYSELIRKLIYADGAYNTLLLSFDYSNEQEETRSDFINDSLMAKNIRFTDNINGFSVIEFDKEIVLYSAYRVARYLYNNRFNLLGQTPKGFYKQLTKYLEELSSELYWVVDIDYKHRFEVNRAYVNLYITLKTFAYKRYVVSLELVR